MVESLDAFAQAFRSLGFVQCPDGSLEPGMEKIALFAKENGRPTHAARQQPNGKWTSKLGAYVDIQHDLKGISGSEYGRPMVFLRRPRAMAVPGAADHAGP